MTPDDVTVAALALLGTPYQHQGRVPGRGVDCIGLVVCVMRTLGLPVEDTERYSGMPGPQLLERIAEQCPQATGPAPGVLALMRWSSEPQHVGIIIAGHSHPLDLVHAWAGTRRVVRHGYDSAWQRRTVQAGWFGLPGVTYPAGVLRGAVRVLPGGSDDE